MTPALFRSGALTGVASVFACKAAPADAGRDLLLDTKDAAHDPCARAVREDFCVVEHECTAVVKGAFLGIPGHSRRVIFRMLHVWDFKDDAISREQIWLDGGSIPAQLTAA